VLRTQTLPSYSDAVANQTMEAAGAGGFTAVLAGNNFRWMAAPALLFAGAMIVFPFGYAVWLALSEVQLGSVPRFIGIGNFRRMLADAEFWNGLYLTLLLYVVSLSLQLVIGTWLGLLLARFQTARGLVRTVMVSPFMLPPVVVGMMAIVILDPSFGIANWLLAKLGLPPALWLSNPDTVMLTIAALDTWQWTPFVALIVMGGYLSLPHDVFESAEMDGAHGWTRFRYVTLPLLGPTLITAAVLRSVDILRFFDIIYLTTQGGPGFSSTTLNILAYRRAFEFFELGYASAIMVTLSAIVFGSVLVFARLRRAVAW
jgi:multiple sugar transport system permease protein